VFATNDAGIAFAISI